MALARRCRAWSRTDGKEGPRTVREGLTRRPALPRATQGVGCMPTKGRHESVAGAEGPMPFYQVLLGVSPRVAERWCRKAARMRPACLCEAGWPVTQGPSRNRAAQQSVSPMQRTIRLNAEAGRRSGKRRRCRKPEAACFLFGFSPAQVAKAEGSDACPQDEHVCSDDRDAGTVTAHGGGAVGNADATHESVLYPSAGRLDSVAGAGSKMPPAVLAVRRRKLRKRNVLTAAGSSRGCPQGEHSWLAARRDLYTFRLGWA